MKTKIALIAVLALSLSAHGQTPNTTNKPLSSIAGTVTGNLHFANGISLYCDFWNAWGSGGGPESGNTISLGGGYLFGGDYGSGHAGHIQLGDGSGLVATGIIDLEGGNIMGNNSGIGGSIYLNNGGLIAMGGAALIMGNPGSGSSSYGVIFLGDSSTSGTGGDLQMQGGRLLASGGRIALGSGDITASGLGGGYLFMDGGAIYGSYPSSGSIGGTIYLGDGSGSHGGTLDVESGAIQLNNGHIFITASDAGITNGVTDGGGHETIRILSNAGMDYIDCIGNDGSSPSSTSSPVSWYHVYCNGGYYWIPLYQ